MVRLARRGRWNGQARRGVILAASPLRQGPGRKVRHRRADDRDATSRDDIKARRPRVEIVHQQFLRALSRVRALSRARAVRVSPASPTGPGSGLHLN
jgi:hypothetical protein